MSGPNEGSTIHSRLKLQDLMSRTVFFLTLFVLAGLGVTFVNGTFSAILADMFPTRVRFSGVALAYNISFTLFSGAAPLLATSLIKETGVPAAPALFLMACGLLSFVASLITRKYEGQIEHHRSALP